MNEQPLVSVFIPYYNDEKYLRQSIESVLNQTYTNFELILLNHATTDNCRNIAHSYNDERIKHIDMPKNYGAGGGILFETMLNASKGKYVKPFCADDVMCFDCLEKLVNYMENNPCIDFAFGNLEYINNKNEDLNENWFNQRPGFTIKDNEVDLVRKYVSGISMLPYIGSIVKQEVLKSISYDYSFIMMFDMSIWLSLLCKGYKIGYLEEIVTQYRIHENQVSTLEKERWALQVSWFERSVFWEILFTIEDVDFVKQIFPDNQFKNKLKDKKDIAFYVTTSVFDSYRPMSYIVLNKMLNNKVYQEHLENEFGFGVKELREKIGESNTKLLENKNLKNLKNKYIYNKNPKDLKFWQLFYLIFHRLVYIITLKPIKRRFRKKDKKYSL